MHKLGSVQTYNRQLIIDALTQHRVEHIEEYAEAIEGYKQHMLSELLKLVDETKAVDVEGRPVKFPDFYHRLDARLPVDKEKEYDHMIKVFEAIQTDEVQLTYNEADCIFNDNWDWALDALLSNSSYSARASSKYRG